MLIELAEALVCPTCRPSHAEESLQGLVAVVEELQDRRVIRGSLGCPSCEARYPIREGVVRLGHRPEEASARPPKAPSGQLPPGGSEPPEGERALQAAALLALHETRGYVLVGGGLEGVAAQLSELAPQSELLLLCDEEAPGGPTRRSGVSRMSGASARTLPLRTGSVAGVLLLGSGGDPEVAEAARVLRPGGRLAVFLSERDPAPEEIGPLLEGAGLRPLALDPRAIVAVRV